MRKKENGTSLEERGTMKDRAKDAMSMPGTKIYIGAFVVMLAVTVLLLFVKF